MMGDELYEAIHSAKSRHIWKTASLQDVGRAYKALRAIGVDDLDKLATLDLERFADKKGVGETSIALVALAQSRARKEMA